MEKVARPWAALWALIIGFFIILIDITIVSIANPKIMEGLKTDINSVIWVTSAYLLAYAVPLLVAGRLGDRFGPKTIYLAGVGAEDENAPAGASAPIRHLGNPYEQYRYAYDKIKRLLATHGASLADAVKQVVYVTDVRFQADVAKCRREAYGDGPIPANTFLVINALAIPGMLLEIDVTAVVAK